MHTEMWQHPATRANVATLRSRGVVVVPPAVGRLTGPD
jgi:phosphopantothenoylcysteine decarboxylase/phosphopantothenate--cysteine ligase